MTWFKIDDGFYDHPKTLALEEGPCFGDAVALWTLSGTWCARQLTDGLVPKRQVQKLGFSAQAAEELVRVGFWTKTPDAYHFHEWEQHQPTREAVEARRRSNAERVAKWRGRQQSPEQEAEGKPAESADAAQDSSAPDDVVSADSVTDADADAACNAVTGADVTESVTPPPSRPVPTRPDPTNSPLTTFEGNSLAHARATPPVVSGSHMQEFGELLRTEAFAQGYSASPRLVGTQLREAADRAREISERTGVSYADAARKLIGSALEAAKATGKAVGLLLLDIDPSRPFPARSNAKADTRSRATTHVDFANAEPLEVQLARIGTRAPQLPAFVDPLKRSEPKRKYASDEEADAAFHAQMEILKQKDLARDGRAE